MSVRVLRRSAIALITVVVAVFALSVPVAAKPKFTARPLSSVGKTIHVAKSPTARLARTDRSLLRLHGKRLIPVMVRFDVDPVASYGGGLSGFRATSPSMTGERIRQGSNRVRSYQRYLSARMASIADSIHRSVPGTHMLRTFKVVYGGASMLVPAGSIRGLLRVPGVVAVQRDRLAHTLTTTTPHFLGADRVWPFLGGPRKAGRNVIVGRAGYGHLARAPVVQRTWASAAFPPAAGCEFGDGSDPDLGEPFSCNRKLIGAYAFTDTYMSVLGALDGEFCNNAPSNAPRETRTGTERTRPPRRPAHRRWPRSSASRAGGSAAWRRERA